MRSSFLKTFVLIIIMMMFSTAFCGINTFAAEDIEQKLISGANGQIDRDAVGINKCPVCGKIFPVTPDGLKNYDAHIKVCGVKVNYVPSDGRLTINYSGNSGRFPALTFKPPKDITINVSKDIAVNDQKDVLAGKDNISSDSSDIIAGKGDSQIVFKYWQQLGFILSLNETGNVVKNSNALVIIKKGEVVKNINFVEKNVFKSSIYLWYDAKGKNVNILSSPICVKHKGMLSDISQHLKKEILIKGYGVLIVYSQDDVQNICNNYPPNNTVNAIIESPKAISIDDVNKNEPPVVGVMKCVCGKTFAVSPEGAAALAEHKKTCSLIPPKAVFNVNFNNAVKRTGAMCIIEDQSLKNEALNAARKEWEKKILLLAPIVKESSKVTIAFHHSHFIKNIKNAVANEKNPAIFLAQYESEEKDDREIMRAGVTVCECGATFAVSPEGFALYEKHKKTCNGFKVIDNSSFKAGALLGVINAGKFPVNFLKNRDVQNSLAALCKKMNYIHALPYVVKISLTPDINNVINPPEPPVDLSEVKKRYYNGCKLAREAWLLYGTDGNPRKVNYKAYDKFKEAAAEFESASKISMKLTGKPHVQSLTRQANLLSVLTRIKPEYINKVVSLWHQAVNKASNLNKLQKTFANTVIKIMKRGVNITSLLDGSNTIYEMFANGKMNEKQLEERLKQSAEYKIIKRYEELKGFIPSGRERMFWLEQIKEKKLSLDDVLNKHIPALFNDDPTILSTDITASKPDAKDSETGANSDGAKKDDEINKDNSNLIENRESPFDGE